VQRREHWENVHRTTAATRASWFQEVPELSLALMDAAGVTSDARVIDVGGGASQLVDHLLDRGFRDLTVLDISGSALDESRRRLGTRADLVDWVEADITVAAPHGRFDLWHDRAVFHFLTGADERRAYVEALGSCLAPRAHLLVATFAEDGPQRCSGLDVVRYSPELLHSTLGTGVELITSRSEQHRTPSGSAQSFVYCLFRRT
jgi:SAM-dependent methyltransferase